MLRLSKKKILLSFWITITLFYTFYAEYLIYHINEEKWHSMSCKNQKDCTRILLAADPQIIGNLNEIFHPITPFSIFDCDRYLKRTYEVAYNFVKPDVVMFLGDLTDEGHIASDEDFNKYVRRIFRIFLEPFSSDQDVKHIWIPGDNDIGGEGTTVTPKHLHRFESAFSQSDVNTVKNVTIFKVNRMTSSIPNYNKEREFYDTSNIFIGVSHMPLMFLPTLFVRKVIDQMLPHVLFTAHEHKCMIISTDALLRQDFHITPITPDNTEVYEYGLGNDDIYEIMVPTCSYRMGTSKIGYGFAVIESNVLKFTVLWSPPRFQYLIIYLILIILPILIFCSIKGCGCVLNLSRTKIKYSKIFNSC